MLLNMHDLDQKDLAGIIGKSRATAYTRYNGRTSFELEEVARLADYFEVSVEAFFAGPEAIMRVLGGGAMAQPMSRQPTPAQPGIHRTGTRGSETTRCSVQTIAPERAAA